MPDTLELVEKRIRKKGKQYCLYSGTGKSLGCGPSVGWAENRERQVNYFKHAHKSLAEERIVAAIEDGSLSVSERDLAVFVQKQRYLAAKDALINVKSVATNPLNIETLYPVQGLRTDLIKVNLPKPHEISITEVNNLLSSMGIDPAGITGFWFDGEKMHVGVNDWRDPRTEVAATGAFGEIVIDRGEKKHLPEQHDQRTHGNRATSDQSRQVPTKEKLKVKKPTKKEANVKGKTSSLEKPLKGKILDKKTIKKVTNTGEKSKRLVEFDDGKKANVPLPVLLKLAFGVGGKGLVGKFFKTKKALHEAGFSSFAQANYLYSSLPDTFWTIYMSAMEGRRVWNPKTKKFLLIDKDLGDTEI